MPAAAIVALSAFALSRVAARWLRGAGFVARDNEWLEPTLDRLALLAFAWCALRQFEPLLECVCR